MAMIMALIRRLPEGRDNQAKHVWRGMMGALLRREDGVGGKTLLVIGIGTIGGRLARLGKAFHMRVIGVRLTPRLTLNNADEVQASKP